MPAVALFGAKEIAACRPNASELSSFVNRLRMKAGLVITTTIASYVALVFSGQSAPWSVAFGIVFALSLVAIGTCVMHDANHGSFSASQKVNRLLGFSGDVVGASSWLWRRKHNVLHHGNTNVVGIDGDIEQRPFARLAPDQPWRKFHRYQHIYMWFLYGFLAVQWMWVSDFVDLLTHRIGNQPMQRRPTRGDVAKVFLGKSIHIIWALAIPGFFHPWWIVLSVYFAIAWLVGFTLAIFFQVAHCVGIAAFKTPSAARRGDDFAMHQLQTTADISCTSPVDRGIAFLMGGLHCQVEHHLAPGLPHTAYPQMSVKVRELCAERQVTFLSHDGFFNAVGAHASWLREMGKRPPLPEPQLSAQSA